jgi:uncharacterized membrane protein
LACLVAFAAVLPFVGVLIHGWLGAIANMIAFAVVVMIWIAFTVRLERRLAVRTDVMSSDVVRRIPRSTHS